MISNHLVIYSFLDNTPESLFFCDYTETMMTAAGPHVEEEVEDEGGSSGTSSAQLADDPTTAETRMGLHARSEHSQFIEGGRIGV